MEHQPPARLKISAARKKAISECIGIMTVEWAYLEFLVDGLIAYFHDFFYGKTIEARKPQQFKRKTNYIRACVHRLETMEWSTVYLPVLDELDQLSDQRNWLIHGILIEANEDKSLKLARHNFKTRPVGLEYLVLNYDEIYVLAQRTQELSECLKGWLTITDNFLEKHVFSKPPFGQTNQ